jgi:hypothetical protein
LLAETAATVERGARDRATPDEAIARGVAALHDAWTQTRQAIETQAEHERHGYHPPETTD